MRALAGRSLTCARRGLCLCGNVLRCLHACGFVGRQEPVVAQRRVMPIQARFQVCPPLGVRYRSGLVGREVFMTTERCVAPVETNAQVGLSPCSLRCPRLVRSQIFMAAQRSVLPVEAYSKVPSMLGSLHNLPLGFGKAPVVTQLWVRAV